MANSLTWTSVAATALACVTLLPVTQPSHAQPTVNCCTPADCPPAAYNGKRVALVSGTDSYSGATPAEAGNGLLNLVNAVRDARAVAEILAPHYAVRCVINPTALEFYRELQQLQSHLTALQNGPIEERIGASVVVHFSGHGSRISGEDHIFLSGKYASLDDAKSDGALSIETIVELFKTFSQFEKTFIFDACRNLSNSPEPIKPSWLEPGFAKPEVHSRSWQTIIYSTESGHFAYDHNAAIGATANGAFVHNLKKYFRFRALELWEIPLLVGTDPAMVSIKQKPVVHSSDRFSARPWTQATEHACLGVEAAVVRGINSCRRYEDQSRACLVTERACDQLHAIRRFQRNGCDGNELRTQFPELQQCPPAAPDTPIERLLGAARVAANVTDLTEMRRVALLSASQQRFDRIADSLRMAVPGRAPASISAFQNVADAAGDLYARVVAAGRTSALPNDVAGLRTRILSQGRLDADRAFSRTTSAPLELSGGNVELYTVPGYGGGTTGVLRPTGAPKVDCETQYCDRDWVAVRVPVGPTSIDGWLPAGRANIRDFAESVDVDFPARSFVPSAEALSPLKSFAEKAKASPNASLRVLAIIPAAANEDAVMLAEARVSYLKLLLTDQAAPRRSIVTHIIKAEAPGTNDTYTVGLLP